MSKRHYYLLAVLLVFAAILRLAISWTELRLLVVKTIPDDAFYYFQIARNLSGGHGVTFDRHELANGFHPLWLAVLTPLYAAVPNNPDLAVHLALTIASCLDVLTGVLVYRIVRILHEKGTAALIGAATYLLNPSVLLHVTNGLETALNLFVFGLCTFFYISLMKKRRRSSSDYVVLGIFLGLLMLARTDNVVAAAVFLGHLFFWHEGRKRYVPVLVAGACASAVVMPWVVWNYVNFGTIVQASANAYSYVRRYELYAQGWSRWDFFWLSLRGTLDMLLRLLPFDVLGGSGLLGLIVGFFLGIAALSKREEPILSDGLKFLLVPTLAFAAVALIHSLVRGAVKSWYLIPGAFVVALFAGSACQSLTSDLFRHSWRNKLIALVAALMVFGGFLYNGWLLWDKGLYRWQSENFMAGQWARENVAAGAVIGSFNSGIIGYFSDRTVVNLDGLANNRAFEKIRQKDLWNYILDREINYLIDSGYSIREDYKDFYIDGGTVPPNLVYLGDIDDPSVGWMGYNVQIFAVRR